MVLWTTAKDGPGKLGGFTKSGELINPTDKAFYGRRGFTNLDNVSPGKALRLSQKHGVSAQGGRVANRATRLAQSAGTADAKMPFLKGARVNHITARPRALSRYNSLAMFNAVDKTPFYSPFQMASKMAGSQAAKSSAFRTAVYGSDEALKSGTQVFQRGMVSMVTAGRKIDRLERKAAGGSGRAAKKVATAQEQVRRLADMNNPINPTGGKALQFGRVVKKSEMAANGGRMISMNAASGLGSTGVNSALAGGSKVGLTGNLMASAGATQGSRFVQGYFRGALGHAASGGLMDEALTGANRAVSHLGAALGDKGLPRSGQKVAAEALEKGVFKTLGVQRTLAVAGTKKGAMVLGARTAAMAIPGLNLIATASLVYDLGKMGGEVVKSGINLAKDAVKSMKGSIDKPMFGMGYKDNEVAATSRARGVAAIQNSRLNARSALGSEGAMMASHFG